MMFEMPQYEARDLDNSEWRDISEIDIMQKLSECFNRVTPAIQQMIEGQQVLTQYAVYRLKRREVSQLGNPGVSVYL
jgi:hypothetical protein